MLVCKKSQSSGSFAWNCRFRREINVINLFHKGHIPSEKLFRKIVIPETRKMLKYTQQQCGQIKTFQSRLFVLIQKMFFLRENFLNFKSKIGIALNPYVK